MINCWLLALTIFFCGLSNTANAQITDVKNGQCFKNTNFAPTFFALNSNEGSHLGSWYKSVFGLQTVKEFAFPNGYATGELMKNNHLAIEIFYLSQLNSLDGPSKGYMKVGIHQDANLQTLKSCLLGIGVAAGRIFKDENLDLDLLYVTDPDGNGLEIIAPRKPD
jgi:hypothetical protein